MQPSSYDGSQRTNLIAAFLAQNCGLGLIFGSYGTILRALQAELHTTRTLAAAGMSVMLLVLGLLSPVIGKLLLRFSIRSVMVAGALLCILAYGLLSVANTVPVMLLGYALVGGGACMLGIIAPTTLISRWFRNDRGSALGIVNLPVLLLLTPPAAAALLTHTGLRGVFGALAACNIALIPLLLRIADHPPSPAGAAHSDTHPETGPPSSRLVPVLSTARFWLVTLGMGILSGAGTTFSVHFVSIATSRGVPLAQASLMMSGYGLCGAAGTYLFAWTTDRLPVHIVLSLNAVVSAVLWTLLLFVSGFLPLLAVACLVGACTTGLNALYGIAIGYLFGVENVSSVMGTSFAFTLPFIFGSAPLVGYLYDRTGSYAAGISVVVTGFILAAIAFAAIVRASPLRKQPIAKLS